MLKSPTAWILTVGAGTALVAITSCSSNPLQRAKGETLPDKPEKPVALTGIPALGENASLNGKAVFPPDNPWNTAIDKEPVDPSSDVIISTIGRYKKLHPDFGADDDGSGPFGIPYLVVSGDTPKMPMSFDYDDESDHGPYPIPITAPVEGGPDADGDRHVLVIDRDHWKLYEMFDSHPQAKGWKAGAGAVYDLGSNKLRTSGWTSADAAGLPIFPGLARYDEVVERKEIPHALRFTVKHSRKGYVFPARHHASPNTDAIYPPMGMRVRLKADYDISKFPPSAQVVLKCLKKYGMILADNGGDWFVSGAPDTRWPDDEINALKRIKGDDFEVVKMGAVER